MAVVLGLPPEETCLPEREAQDKKAVEPERLHPQGRRRNAGDADKMPLLQGRYMLPPSARSTTMLKLILHFCASDPLRAFDSATPSTKHGVKSITSMTE